MRTVGLIVCHIRTLNRLQRFTISSQKSCSRAFSTERLRKIPSSATPPGTNPKLSQPSTCVDDEVVERPTSLRHPLTRGTVTVTEAPSDNQAYPKQVTSPGDRIPLDGTLDSWEWLSQLSPGYTVHGSQVRIIQDPTQFYQTLVERSRTARSRISLASLYLGTGSLEQELVNFTLK